MQVREESFLSLSLSVTALLYSSCLIFHRGTPSRRCMCICICGEIQFSIMYSPVI